MADEGEGPRPLPASLPVLWKHQGKTIARSQTKIHLPTTGEVATFANAATMKTCANCTHFRGPQKDRQSIAGFVAAAIHEAQWKMGFLGDKPENLGRCGEDAQLVVGPNSKACTHHTART